MNKNLLKRSVVGKGMVQKTMLIIVFGLVLCAFASPSYAAYFSFYAGCDNNLDGFGGGKVQNQLSSDLPVGSVIQYIYAGPDATIQPPDASGNITGDDVLLLTTSVGDDIPWSGFINTPGCFYNGYSTTYTTAGPKIYVRAWNSSAIGSSTYYGNSALFNPNTDPSNPPMPNDTGIATFSTNVAFVLTPAISNVSPIGATAAGSTITISGSNFGSTQGTGKVRFVPLAGGASVEAASYTSWGSTSVVVTNPGLTTGTYEVTVTSNSGTTGTWQTFYYGISHANSISGSPANRGATGITISGINFGASAGTLHFGSLTPTATSWSNTSITFTVPATAATGSNNVYITTAAGDSNTIAFTVNSTMLIVCAPNSAYKGDTISVGITGTNTDFVPSTTVSFGSNTSTTTTYVSATSLTCLVTIDTSAAQGARTVTVTTNNPYAETIPQGSAFTINTPSFTSVTPNSGAQGSTHTGVAIVGTGTHFGGTTTVDFGSNITVSNISASNATHLTCDIVISTEATLGARNVVVTTGGETVTGTGVFTVTATASGGQLIYEKAGGIMMAYPNPFDPNDKANPLKMLFNTATGEAVDIYIFDTNARIIYQRRSADPLAADRTVTWDGETSYGEVVENGLYLIRVVKDGKLVAKGKILVIKK